MIYKMAEKTKWKKVLYEDRGFPDNYVDDSFLDEMKKNLYIRNYDYWTVVKGSGEITQQISSVCIFVITYVHMSEKQLAPESLVAVTTLTTILGYCLLKSLDLRIENDDKIRKRTVLDDVKTFAMFMGFSYGLSPVLVSLTETVSTDTIYAMTTLMLLANLLFHNYGADAAMVSEALSLNAGFFASVCLASRLHTSWHSFAIVSFSLQVFGLWPMFRKRLKDKFHQTQLLLTLTTSLMATLALMSVSVVTMVIFIGGHIFITFLCPVWLINLQPYKNNIYGPWDEAVIKED